MIEESTEAGSDCAAAAKAARIAYAKELGAEREEELRERFIYLAASFAPAKGTYEYLESRSGVPATRWKNVLLRRQMPTLSMIVGLMQYRGEYAQWLVTGEGYAPTTQEWERFLTHQRWMKDKKSGASKS